MALAATSTQVLNAIDLGLANVAAQQGGDGSWNYSGYPQAGTAAAVFAMQTQSANWGSNSSAYQSDVDKGMAYLLSTATLTTVGGAGSGAGMIRADGNSPCPGGAGSCAGVYWDGNGEATYSTGLVAQAIGAYAVHMPNAVATTSGPLAGMTWSQIAQAVTNTFAAGQTANGTSLTGGWRYFPGTQDSDSSTTQWAVTALIYDQSLGASTPAIVKTDLAKWYPNVQAGDGSVCYQPGAGPCDHADTGGLLLGMKFLGADTSNAMVQKALSFINGNWTQGANNTWYGNFGDPYAMWAIYKGLETMVGLNDTSTITNLLTDCGIGASNGPSSGVCNWYQDYEQWLVANQNQGDGSWGGTAYWTGMLATSFDLAILSATEVPIQTPEPASLALLGAGAIALAGLRRRNH